MNVNISTKRALQFQFQDFQFWAIGSNQNFRYDQTAGICENHSVLSFCRAKLFKSFYAEMDEKNAMLHIFNFSDCLKKHVLFLPEGKEKLLIGGNSILKCLAILF